MKYPAALMPLSVACLFVSHYLATNVQFAWNYRVSLIVDGTAPVAWISVLDLVLQFHLQVLSDQISFGQDLYLRLKQINFFVAPSASMHLHLD